MVEDEEWMQRARCRGENPDMWFTENADPDRTLALQLCGECRVRADCLEYALVHRIDFGLWGGESERQRVRIRKRRARD